MGFGSTAKKIQKLATIAERTYETLNEVVEDLQRLREDFETTSQRVEGLERELAEQRAIVEALAEREGLDVAELVADVEVQDVESDAGYEEPEPEGEPTSSNEGNSTGDESGGAD